jgi:hypothetical protein
MSEKLRVKVVSKNRIPAFQFFQLPQSYESEICWVLDPQARDYDWLVVYDDLPLAGGERLSLGIEELACPQEQTVLVTYEPSSIKYYGGDYAHQYGMVLTSQPERALSHRNRVDCPPVGFWFYGGVEQAAKHASPPEKTKNVSMFFSAKAQKHSLHNRRVNFLTELKGGLGDDIELFGKGYNFVEHKAAGIDDFRYHIAVENHIGDHHWTEKLSDAFLGYSLPFYSGCSNAADYFPEESFIDIDIRDTAASLNMMRQAIADNEYEKRLPAIIEARRRVLEDYNLGNLVARHILESGVSGGAKGGRILSRHAMQRRDLPTFLRYAVGKISSRRYYRKYWQAFLES